MYVQNTAEKVNGLSILRVLAMLMIVMVHFGQSLPLPEMIHRIISYGQNGVILFFALSGFLIALSLQNDDNLKRYYQKRILRIVPLYYTAVLISMIGFSLLGIVETDIFKLGWFRYFLFLQTILPSNNVNLWNNCSALWTMSAFMLFYIFAPVFHMIHLKGNKRFVILVAMLCGVNVMNQYVFLNIMAPEVLSESMVYLSTHSAVSVQFVFALGMYTFYITCGWNNKEKNVGGGYFGLFLLE